MAFAALLVAAVFIPGAAAQSPDGSPSSTTIATDRPAVTDSSAVVPKGTFQAENGVLDTGNPAGSPVDFPETLIRIGIGPSTELRFTAPDYYAGQRSGFGDLLPT